ncbi:hypothetical protein BaRGS_00021605 [Batillaria attramentaria]|uniref:Uncharacterized protein n=1 Tax=Batillaria attramentaria TaxID=370345 RepID=A0ABD0KIU4_9CAEN
MSSWLNCPALKCGKYQLANHRPCDAGVWKGNESGLGIQPSGNAGCPNCTLPRASLHEAHHHDSYTD